MPVGVERPSYDELAALVVVQAERIRVLEGQVAELSARLGLTSRNSSKPPSSDGLGKPAPRSLRTRSGRGPGGQPGHPGVTLRQVAVPDEVVRHEPAGCGCGRGLAGAPVVGVERRQVFDLPEVRVWVIEHQVVSRRCGCGRLCCGDAPAGVAAPVQYGPRVGGVGLYLYAGQFLSKARTARALADLFGVAVSAGTVADMAAGAAEELGRGFLGLVRGRLAASEVVHFDETGLRVAGRLHWVHSASTGKYSLITVHRRRGVEGMDAAGVLPGFAGVAVHDAWAPYDTYTTATHALCCTHVLRELQAVIDAAEPGSWCWARQVADALLDMNDLVKAARAAETGVDPAVLAAAVHQYRPGAQIGISTTADRTSGLMKKHHALARRLIGRQDDYLRFTVDPRVPFTNNAAEREIRMVKLRQKVSGCLRTLTGAEQFTAIRSYLATAAKHGIGFLDALTRLAAGDPWLPETA